MNQPLFAPYPYPGDPTYVAPRIPTRTETAVQGTRAALREQVLQQQRQPLQSPRPLLPFAEPEPRPRVNVVRRAPWAFPSSTPETPPWAQRRPNNYRPGPTSTTPGPASAPAEPRFPTRNAPRPQMSIPSGSRGVAAATTAGVGIGSGVITAGSVLASGGGIGDAIAIGGGVGAGTAAGSVIGGAIGGAIGAIGGPAGIAGGTAAGQWIGGGLGAAGGRIAGQGLLDLLRPDIPFQEITGLPALTEPPPFLGGQSPGVTYVVNVRFNDGSGTQSVGAGPIQQALWYDIGSPVFIRVRVVFANFTFDPGLFFARSAEFTINRADGQPDTGGNIPGAPISPAGVRVGLSPASTEPPAAVGQGSPPPIPGAQGNSGFPGLQPAPKPQRNLPPGEAPAPVLEPNPPAEGELSPEDNPASRPAPAGAPLTIGQGATRTTVRSGQIINVETETVDQWAGNLRGGGKVRYNSNPDGSADLEFEPEEEGSGLGPLAAAGALGVGGILASGPRTAPRGNPSPLGTALAPPEKVSNAPQGETTKPPQPPPQYPETSNACGCNVPLLSGLGQLGQKIDLLGAAGEAASTAAILAELAKISGAVGVTGFPASVPGNLANPAGGTRSLSSLAELGLWQTEQLDGLVGQFPNTTKVETPDGDVDLELPNVSESLSEIIGMLVALTASNSQILHTSSRALHQAGSATQQAHLAQLFSRANAEFLGYESRANSVDLPLAYTPGANPFQGFLNEGTAKIRGFENTDGQDLKSILSELLQAAAIIRAVFYRRLDPSRDFKEQMQEVMRGQGTFLDQETARNMTASDWEAYLQQVEQGFAARTGDGTPYGRDASERPQIRDLSNPSTDGGTP